MNPLQLIASPKGQLFSSVEAYLHKLKDKCKEQSHVSEIALRIYYSDEELVLQPDNMFTATLMCGKSLSPQETNNHGSISDGGLTIKSQSGIDGKQEYILHTAPQKIEVRIR